MKLTSLRATTNKYDATFQKKVGAKCARRQRRQQMVAQ
jgi:hypothetical protein